MQQYKMGVLTHVTDIQKTALEKINQDLTNITFIIQSEASSLATDQAEQKEHIIKMELEMNELEIEMNALKKAESDYKCSEFRVTDASLYVHMLCIYSKDYVCLLSSDTSTQA